MKFRLATGLAIGIWLGGSVVGRAQARPKITGISHLSVYTTDPAKAEQYYVHDLGGFKAADPQDSTGVRYYFNPVQFIEVLPLPGGTSSVNRMDHTAYNTVDAEALRRYLGAHSVTVPAVATAGSDGSHYFFVMDPEGNKVEFVQPPARPQAVPENPVSHRIIHLGSLVHDQAAEEGFYRDILGFRPYWHGGKDGRTTDWVSMQVPDGTDWYEFMMVHGPEKTGIPAGMTQASLGVLDHFSLGVRNMEQTMNVLYVGDRLGVKHSGTQIGMDGKWQLNLYDPDGIRAEFMEFQPVAKPCCSPFLAANPTE